MKKVTILTFTLLLSTYVWAQPKLTEKPIYQFTDVKTIPVTASQCQYKTSTCWSYGTLALIEAELLRMGKGEHNLSEMYIARRNSEKKTDKFVRMHGEINYAPGGLSVNAFEIIKEYGLLPEEVYKGLNYGEEMHDHSEVDRVLEAYAHALIKGRKLTSAWKQGLNGILDAYFGEVPKKFNYRGKEYTPQSYAESLSINPDDYILITSYTHHPFYKPFALELPDNYYWGEFYNLPLDEMMGVIDNALETGYTMVWNMDMSSKGYNFYEGYGVVPEKEEDLNQTSSDRERWETASGNKSNKKKEEPKLTPVKEKNVTQEIRQKSFDSYETVDDHLMLIMGTAKDQNGNRFYKVKDSWKIYETRYQGYVYVSIPYMRFKTIAITVHKDAIPADIAAKLGLK